MGCGSSRGSLGTALVALGVVALAVAIDPSTVAAQAATTAGRGSTAQPNPDQTPDQPSVEFEQRDSVARQHFQWGGEAYARGNFDDAIREFREAHRLSGRPLLLFNLYLAYRDARRDVEARDTLRDYLALVPDARNRGQLEARLRALESALASSTAATSTETTPAETRAAAHATTANDAEPRERQDDDASAVRPRRASAESESGSALPTIGWIGVSVGGAALVGALITGIFASGAASDLEAGCSPSKRCPAALRSTYDEASTFGTATDVLWIGGGVLALGGVALLLLTLLTDEQEPASTTVGSVAACSATGCSAELRVAF